MTYRQRPVRGPGPPRPTAQPVGVQNYFVLKSLWLTRPLGLVAVLTSRYTMDARNPGARREITALADLVGAIRLPSGAHQKAAGTSVVTDLLILRRREPGRAPAPAAWEQAHLAELDGTQVPVNEYFLAHPHNVLGELTAVHGAYRAGDLTVRPTGDAIAALVQALQRLAADAKSQGLGWAPPGPAQPTPRPPAPAPAGGSQEPDGYLRARDDATFTKVVDGAEQPHLVPRTQAAELRELLVLRDVVRALLDAEAASPDATPDMGRLRRQLGQRYDAYATRYGPLNRYSLRPTGRTDPRTGEPRMARIRPPQGGFRDDPYSALVFALEEFEPVGQRAAKAAIFTRRVVAPRVPRLGADTPADALAICLDTYGKARLGEIARLLGTTKADAREQLGMLVFDEPGTGRLVSAAGALPGGPLYVHLDLDVIDPSDVPGLRYPAPGGPGAADIAAALRTLLATGRVAAVGIACTWHVGHDAAARIGPCLEAALATGD